jgi:hypothetical protein
LITEDTLAKAIEGFAEESAVEMHCAELRQENKHLVEENNELK